jgi:hypothetical protein
MKISQLRVLQIVCLVMALSACWLVAHLGNPKGDGETGSIQWVIALVAVYCAASGFTLQRKITKGPARFQQTKGRSTPLSRWKAGNLARLLLPVSVAAWGDVLRISGGPLWLAYVLCGLGIILLLGWSPGTAPVPKPFGKTA